MGELPIDNKGRVRLPEENIEVKDTISNLTVSDDTEALVRAYRELSNTIKWAVRSLR